MWGKVFKNRFELDKKYAYITKTLQKQFLSDRRFYLADIVNVKGTSPKTRRFKWCRVVFNCFCYDRLLFSLDLN